VTNVFAIPHRETGRPGPADHEQVVFCQDHHTGLKAIIGIYSTALGPALGGTRFYPYASEDEALADVLRLSAAMAYKNALACPASIRRRGPGHSVRQPEFRERAPPAGQAGSAAWSATGTHR